MLHSQLIVAAFILLIGRHCIDCLLSPLKWRFIESRFPSPMGSHVYHIIRLRSDAKLSSRMRRDRRREARTKARTASISHYSCNALKLERISLSLSLSLHTVRAPPPPSPLNSFRDGYNAF